MRTEGDIVHMPPYMHVFSHGGSLLGAVTSQQDLPTMIWGVSVWSLHVLGFLRVFSLYVCLRICIFVCPVADWWPVQGVPRLSQNAWWDGLESPVTLGGISSIEIGWMDEHLSCITTFIISTHVRKSIASVSLLANKCHLTEWQIGISLQDILTLLY